MDKPKGCGDEKRRAKLENRLDKGIKCLNVLLIFFNSLV